MRNCIFTYALMGWAFFSLPVFADEVEESEVGGPGDAFVQMERLAGWATEVRSSQPAQSAPEAKLPTVSVKTVEAAPEVDPFGDVGKGGDSGPLAASQGFSPRTLGSGGGPLPEGLSVRATPKSEGMGGSPKVKFGERGDISLQTISKNNAASVEAIAQAAPSSSSSQPPPFTIGGAAEDEGPTPKTFEERLEELSSKEAPFYVRDYVEYRAFVAEFEEKVGDLPNQDSRFHDNLKRVYAEFGEKDGDRAGAGAIRRVLRISAGTAKAGPSKRRTGPAGRTH